MVLSIPLTSRRCDRSDRGVVAKILRQPGLTFTRNSWCRRAVNFGRTCVDSGILPETMRKDEQQRQGFCRISESRLANLVNFSARTLDELICSTSKGCAFLSM